MPIRTRFPLRAAACALVVALSAGGCGNKHDAITKAETEGPYVTVGELKYQVQISRQLNPQDVEDRDYFRGVPEEELELGTNEAWFGVFISVFNQDKDTAFTSADTFLIEDTLKTEYEPVEIELDRNPFAYFSDVVPTEGRYPSTESVPGANGIGGKLLLFKLTYASIANRPLELHIEDALGRSATISLDV